MLRKKGKVKGAAIKKGSKKMALEDEDRVLIQEKTRDRISKKAYELYESRGYSSGNDWADWFEAEKIISSENR